jgi:small basic protein (TIGR04137 family)
MTIDQSLKVKAGAVKNRNVLTRAERLQKLKADDRWTETSPALGLPKVRVTKISLKKKKKEKKEEEGDKKTEKKPEAKKK